MAVSLKPDEFRHGLEFTPDNPAPKGQGWTIPELGYEGETELRINPLHLVDNECRLAFQLYSDHKGGHPPEPGGALHQSLATMTSFRIMAAAEAALDKYLRP